MTGAESEQVQTGNGPGFGDAVTITWGDPERALFGSLRVSRTAVGTSVVAVLFAAGEVAASAVGEDPGAVDIAVHEPLRAWRSSWDGANGWELELEALCAPLELDPDEPLGQLAGLQGYEQLCRVQGSVRVDGRETPVDCLGQRGHQWGAPDWSRLSVARSLGAWLGPDRAVLLSAARRQGARGHAEESLTGWLLLPSDGGAAAERIADPRLSTAYDGEGRQRRAGLELGPGGEDAYPRRGAGEVICGTSIELGHVRLDAAFFSWRMDGAHGVGRYDVVRRIA